MLPEETLILEQIATVGPLQTFRQGIAANDALIRETDLENGQLIASQRSAIYTALVAAWAAEQHQSFGYGKPFAVVALGGTGRGEMAPYSDNDFAFLFDEALEGNPFLLQLQRQILHSTEFKERHGFTCLALHFSLDDVPSLSGKQLNSFLDMRPVYDPDGLSHLFRQRIRATFDPFEHFLHVRSFWKGQWERAAGETERLDRFDIKNDGLRVFLAGIWTLASREFVHSHEVYQSLEEPRDLSAYYFLLRLRAFVHSRRKRQKEVRPGGTHPEDLLGFDDFTSFGELLEGQSPERRFAFADEVRARLLSARRRVARFARGVIERELKKGHQVSPGSPIVYGVGGLSHTRSEQFQSPLERSRAVFALLLLSQHYGVPIDPAELETTFRDAGDWLVLTPDLSALFYEQRGSLADSFAFLAQLDGAQERLFPGYARFEASLDARVLAERKFHRGALEGQKMRTLEQLIREGRAQLASTLGTAQPTEPIHDLFVSSEAALLDADHLVAIKLALKTKCLCLNPEEESARRDPSRQNERFSSGYSDIPLAAYYVAYRTKCDFSSDTIRTVEFLISHSRAFKVRAEAGINDEQQVEELVWLCQNEPLLRSLFIFTCADRLEWEPEEIDPARWFNMRELYLKALRHFRPEIDPAQALQAAGYSPDQVSVLRDFGDTFFGGVYRQYANHFGAHLLQLVETAADAEPKASLLRDGTSVIVGVASRDYRGLAASISGAFWRSNVDIQQAHLFSATHHNLALDFFHLRRRDKPLPSNLTRFIKEAIAQRLYIGAADEAAVPQVFGEVSLREWRPGQFCLRFESADETSAVIYALTYKVFRFLRGNIFGLTAHAGHGRGYVSVYHALPSDLTFNQAQKIVAEHF